MKKIIAPIILTIIIPNLALAAGIQVTPERLEFELNQAQSKEIIVANPTGDVQLFEAYSDDYEQSIKLNPESFTLEAGGRKKVIITVKPQKFSGVTSTNISIIAKPLSDNRVKINTGVKIPILIKQSEFSKYNKGLIGLTIIIIAAVSYYLISKKKNSN